MTYELNTEINVASEIKSQLFNFTRIYHSKGVLNTDTVECKVIGITPVNPRFQSSNQTSPMDQSNKRTNDEI